MRHFSISWVDPNFNDRCPVGDRGDRIWVMQPQNAHGYQDQKGRKPFLVGPGEGGPVPLYLWPPGVYCRERN